MFEDSRPARLSIKKPSPGIKRTIGGLYRSRAISRVLILLALATALFGGVGLDVCLSQPIWEKHLWIPALLIVLAVWVLVATLLQSIRMKLFSK